LNSIWWTFDSLNRLVNGTLLFYRDQKPFTLSYCDIRIHNEDDILEEVQKYKDLITVTRSTEMKDLEEYWNQTIDEWDLEQANYIYRCEYR